MITTQTAVKIRLWHQLMATKNTRNVLSCGHNKGDASVTCVSEVA